MSPADELEVLRLFRKQALSRRLERAAQDFRDLLRDGNFDNGLSVTERREFYDALAARVTAWGRS